MSCHRASFLSSASVVGSEICAAIGTAAVVFAHFPVTNSNQIVAARKPAAALLLSPFSRSCYSSAV